MLHKREWLVAAQALPEGGRSRINHTCGDGRTLQVFHNRENWGSFCFRCDEHGFEAKPTESWRERLERLTREQGMDEALEWAMDPPGPPNFDVVTWPVEARVWLYKAGCGLPEISALGAYWHSGSGRLVLPVFQGDDLIYWQARDVKWSRTSKRSKYINPRVNKQCLVAKYGRGSPLVLTEDVLSAFRVGQLTEAWSLLGTNLTDHIAAAIPSNARVLVWLDPDRAGIRAARTITKQLTGIGIDARTIRSRADPKCLSNREIQIELLHTA